MAGIPHAPDDEATCRTRDACERQRWWGIGGWRRPRNWREIRLWVSRRAQ